MVVQLLSWGQYYRVIVSNKILVVDTSIWIDLSTVRLIDLFFNSPYSILATDFVQTEEPIHINWRNLEEKGLQYQSLSPLEVGELYNLRQIQRKTSLVDLAMFFVAQKTNGILLTGDKDLRNYAQQYIEVHGFLLILNELVDLSILSTSRAISELQHILQLSNTRLPQKECEQLITRWKNQPKT